MSYMFNNATEFNQDIGGWDTEKVTTMVRMFLDAQVFNQDIGNWNTISVTTMAEMFRNAPVFNQDISSWDVSSVTNMSGIFQSASGFNQNISSWCVTNITSEPVDFATNSALTNINKPIWGNCPASYSIDVTATSSSDYTLNGTDRNGNITGNDPNLTFTVGDTISFVVNASGHPFYLKTVAGTGTGDLGSTIQIFNSFSLKTIPLN